VRTTLDYPELKKSLGAVRWAQQKVEHFSDVYYNRIKRCADFRRMTSYSREYYGRMGSILKQIKRPLEYLELSRKAMKDFPSIKTKLFTVAIAGFPNVGKTTLLTKLTTAKPKIANYAFTTKQLNTGYATIKNHKVQFIDTPGTLNRFNKMNPIEKQAFLAMKYCADLIIFVFDTSDQAYDPATQKKLLSKLKDLGKPICIYLSKTDISGKDLPVINEKDIYKNPKELKRKIAYLL
jgi:nucleolar GTP-binding protein